MSRHLGAQEHNYYVIKQCPQQIRLQPVARPCSIRTPFIVSTRCNIPMVGRCIVHSTPKKHTPIVIKARTTNIVACQASWCKDQHTTKTHGRTNPIQHHQFNHSSHCYTTCTISIFVTPAIALLTSSVRTGDRNLVQGLVSDAKVTEWFSRNVSFNPKDL